MMAESGNPVQGFQFRRFAGGAGPTMKHLGFVQPFDRFGHGLSWMSPLLPTEGSMPSSTSRLL
jgi:hypothetical protein